MQASRLDDTLSTPSSSNHLPDACLCDKSRSSRALVSPGRRQGTDGLVVAGETVDPGLDQNEAELAVLVLAVALEVLADSDGLKTISIELLRRTNNKNQIESIPS